MNGVNGEGGRADRNIFGSTRLRCTVAHPLALVRNDRLSRLDVESAAMAFDPQETFENQGVFVELRSLPGLNPAFRAPHMGYADAGGGGVHPADVFVDELRLVAGRLDSSR